MTDIEVTVVIGHLIGASRVLTSQSSLFNE